MHPTFDAGRPTRLVWSSAAAAASHALLLIAALVMLTGARHGRVLTTVAMDAASSSRLTFLNITGPGGGGGGSGNRQAEPVRRLQRIGHDATSVPGPPPTLAHADSSHEPDPVDRVIIPVRPLGDALASMPGLIDVALRPTASSLGPGRGALAGSGDGDGLGGGRGPGVDAGDDGGIGGGPFAIGAGITMPILLHAEKPRYSLDAMRARVQGIVIVECVVQTTGRCSDIRVARSLDPSFGLDDEARRAAALWRFKPGTRRGRDVPVVVRMELEFTIR